MVLAIKNHIYTLIYFNTIYQFTPGRDSQSIGLIYSFKLFHSRSIYISISTIPEAKGMIRTLTIIYFMLSFVRCGGTLYYLDVTALTSTNYERAIRPRPGDQVLIGEYIDEANVTSNYYVEMNKVPMTTELMKEQLEMGIDALTGLYSTERQVELQSHYANNWLSREGEDRRRTVQEDSNEVGKSKAVIKKGAKQLDTGILSTATNIASSLVQTEMNRLLNSTECLQVMSPIPIGKSWKSSGVTGFLAICAVGGKKKCDIKTTPKQQQLDQALEWADRAMSRQLHSDEFLIGFSDGGSWQLCLRIVQNFPFHDYAGAKKHLHQMKCPKGYCDGVSFDVLPVMTIDEAQ